ncbi:MAG: hypothetical protein QF385_14940, partial [SAR324 cluster bacterium]|nr:hypothetical protein [SAR324 cluster bacterium]
ISLRDSCRGTSKHFGQKCRKSTSGPLKMYPQRPVYPQRVWEEVDLSDFESFDEKCVKSSLE